MSTLRLAVVLGSTRPGRNGRAVADRVIDRAGARSRWGRYECCTNVGFAAWAGRRPRARSAPGAARGIS
ncbi:hypothetical protein [Streptomyces triticiradicis]|uniref:NADPH-dependent FMN reductase n=1 Tax=Streptomyces triticiradicis TaxID=2651189 RepID=A0A7J5DFM1_9ACTN|nr:hypothetical protein [Streptomyces triticiradicis]KAB1987476.1 hypothetical protein F8144_17270 [Streptomyces triticiradicis]